MAQPLPEHWTHRDLVRAAGLEDDVVALAQPTAEARDRPHRAEAVRVVRDLYGISPAELSDDQVADLYATHHVELALAVADVKRRIIGTGPGRRARALLVRVAVLLARLVSLLAHVRPSRW